MVVAVMEKQPFIHYQALLQEKAPGLPDLIFLLLEQMLWYAMTVRLPYFLMEKYYLLRQNIFPTIGEIQFISLNMIRLEIQLHRHPPHPITGSNYFGAD